MTQSELSIVIPFFNEDHVLPLLRQRLDNVYLGVFGEYIGQMFIEVKARPSFIVERTINIETTQRSNEGD